MSASDRQSRLLVAEDWKRIYQSFRNADFQSYDFDNLRRTMINYLRQNYPEDFNDYIESSEYLALIDMIAFLGQNLSFRIDLNARENFLETAERRESVLRLARMLAYNPRRNQAANGLLKIETVKTTENIQDSTGLNLSGTTVKWNDRANPNFFEQFIKVLNAALPASSSIGNPLKSASINRVQTQKYRFNATNTGSAIYPFSKSIEGISTRFEIVSTDIQGDNIVEEPPLPGTSPAFLFRDDGQGISSSNTGFFMHFRQGRLDSGNFSVNNPTPNQVVSIDAENINDTDVWLYNIDSSGVETIEWTKLAAVEGNNIIYNSLFRDIRNVFAVATRANDRINLVFSDGVFGNLPSGNFKVFYRTSDNTSSVITPGAIGNVNIDIRYQSASGAIETLTLGLRLKQTVTNGAASESNDDIKRNAPATYYTQNRLITGEDYNVGPLAISQEIIKVKTTNRISSGISKYFDLRDVSGKYSNTNVFANDGVLYKETFERRNQFRFNTQSDIEGIILNTVEPIINSQSVRNFYLSEYPRIITEDLNAHWSQVSTGFNRTTGVFRDVDNDALPLGAFTETILRLVEAGTMCKFVAPSGFHFMPDGTLMAGEPNHYGATTYRWSKVISVREDGTTENNGQGAVVLTDNIPTNAILTEIIPKLSNTLSDDLKLQMIDRIFAYRDFALRYDRNSRAWRLVTAENVNTANQFSTGKAGDTSGQNLDSSWLLHFKTNGETYTITHRNLRYIFESANEVRFFFDKADRIYDPKTGQTVRDKITVLNINRRPDSTQPFLRDFNWTIIDGYRDKAGYVDTRKIQVQFFDADFDDAADDPDLFDTIVDEEVNSLDKIILQKRYITSDNVEDFKFFDNSDGTVKIVEAESAVGPLSKLVDGQVFYLARERVFKEYDQRKNLLVINTDYRAFVGRSGLKFHYVHVADSNYRIDPSASNLHDVYLLTKTYDRQMREYLRGVVDTQPRPPSNDDLFRSYNPDISQIKSISDEIVYHPVKYKVLFGEKADPDLQVRFKIVRNSNLVLNENELKADVIQAIERFFAIENWDFGETFYFQELSAYIMNSLSPKLVSIVIVPRQASQAFGSLFEIKSELDEIFISAARVSDIQIIDEITATELQANGNVITSVTTTTRNNVVSAPGNGTLPNSGGYNY